jgi:hypothetical protein
VCDFLSIFSIARESYGGVTTTNLYVAHFGSTFFTLFRVCSTVVTLVNNYPVVNNVLFISYELDLISRIKMLDQKKNAHGHVDGEKQIKLEMN